MFLKLRSAFSLSRRPHLLSSTLTLSALSLSALSLSALSLAYMTHRHHHRSQSSTLCCIALRENLSAVEIDHRKSTIALSARQCGGFAAGTRVQRWGKAGAWVYFTMSKWDKHTCEISEHHPQVVKVARDVPPFKNYNWVIAAPSLGRKGEE